MQNNQQSGSSQGGQEKPKQTLSWAEPQQMLQKKATGFIPPAGGQAPGTGRSNDTKTVGEIFSSKPKTMFVIGLIVGCLITWIWFDMRTSRPAQTTGNASSTAGGTSASTGTSSSKSGNASAEGSSLVASNASSTAASDDTITVPSTQNAGLSVEVSSLSASDAVWVVVYEDNNGKVGNALGAARFTPARTSGTVELIRSTLPNLTYFVGLTADTPDHTFSIKANTPILDTNGNQIMTQFAAQ